MWRTQRKRASARRPDNPWDGQTLEWATTSPPPPHNFDTLPPIRSNRPVWDRNHPDHRSPSAHGANAQAAVDAPPVSPSPAAKVFDPGTDEPS